MSFRPFIRANSPFHGPTNIHQPSCIDIFISIFFSGYELVPKGAYFNGPEKKNQSRIFFRTSVVLNNNYHTIPFITTNGVEKFSFCCAFKMNNIITRQCGSSILLSISYYYSIINWCCYIVNIFYLWQIIIIHWEYSFDIMVICTHRDSEYIHVFLLGVYDAFLVRKYYS